MGWLGNFAVFVIGAAAGALPALLGVLWGYLTLRRGLRGSTIE